MLNALEYLRNVTEHLHKDTPAAQRKLREDRRIKDLEKIWKRRTHGRLDHAQVIKAAGSLSDSLTNDERLLLSRYWLLHSKPTSIASLGQDLRNRAMFSLAVVTAFRGDNAREIRLSDLSFFEHPVPKRDSPIPMVVIISNQGKTNQNGRQDQTAFTRHADVNLCAVGALGFLLWFTEHVLEVPEATYVPDFSNEAGTAGYGKYGYREWYQRVLFPGKISTSPTQADLQRPMAYSSLSFPLLELDV